MHLPPPVSYPVERSRGVGVALAGLGAAGSAAVGWWSLQGGAPGMRSLAVLPALLLAGLALRQWAAARPGVLRWDGRAWYWSGREGVPGAVVAGLDFQRLLLLRWHSTDGQAEWLWLVRGTDPRCWADLRRAVYSRASPDALPEADSPAANP